MGSVQEKTALKLHPGDHQKGHIYSYIEDKKYSNISLIKNECSFSVLVHHSEIILVDFPSTTLLQAISSKKVVFVLLKYLSISGNARNLLMKRAYCSDDPGELLDMMERYISGLPMKQHPDVNNTEFLEEFGISCNDGRVAERVMSVLNEHCA